jgi:hypothetical protein
VRDGKTLLLKWMLQRSAAWEWTEVIWLRINKWQSPVNMALIFRFTTCVGVSPLAAELLASQE